MSHFRQIKTQLKDTACLIAALVDLGFHPKCHGKAREDLLAYQAQREKLGNPEDMPDLAHFIGEYTEPQICWSYDGERRYDDEGKVIVGEIVIHRKDVGSYSNDVGYKWDEESGTYVFLRSEFDTRSNRCSDTANFPFRLMSEYGKHNAYAVAREIGGTVTETRTAEGLRQYRITRKAPVVQQQARSARVTTGRR